jgi:hypothetical protein
MKAPSGVRGGIMKIVSLGLAVGLWALVGTAAAAEPVSQTYAASSEQVWRTAEAVLKQFGWDIDKADRSIGWITTDSRGLEGGDYGVYAKGTRHRLRIHIKPEGERRTTVSVERMVFKRERILWMDKDEAIPAADQSVEKSLLSAIEKSL